MSDDITIYSAMPLLSKNGPAAMLKDYGWQINFIVDIAKDPLLPVEITAALHENAADIEYLIADITPLKRDFFEKAKKLKLVSMFGAGVNHIDIQAATDHGVVVTNAVGANAQSTAELCITMMFALARHIPAMHSSVLSGAWKGTIGSEIYGKTLGVIGFGTIGSRVARMGKALGMKVIAYNRSPKPELAASLGVELKSLEEVISEADYVSLNTPATPDNTPIIGREELARMKPTACLINAGRGSLVDIDALAEALLQSKLGGAGLDVFPTEPVTSGVIAAMPHPITSLPNVVFTPHAGALTNEAINNVARSCFEEISRMLKGEESPNCRNREVYAKL